MLTIKRVLNQTGCYDYHLKDGDDELKILFGGNGDLYFAPKISEGEEFEYEFLITKENMFLYNLFEELYYNVKDAKVFSVDEYELEFMSEELDKKYESVKIRNEYAKKISEFQNLFKNEIITWISDDSEEFDENKSDLVQIIKEQEQYRVKFKFHSKEHFIRSVRFRNARSRYKPFNIIFMKFYINLQEYDPEYHQIHIEEYLYEKNKVKKLTK